MSNSQPKLTENTLFLAFTRPAMIAGVPVEAMAVNIMLTSVVYLVGQSFLFLSVGVVLHFVFKQICVHDHNQFRVLFVWMKTKGRARNSRYWGGSSFTPLKLLRRFDKKEIL